MALQSSGTLTARNIANEFGYSRGSTNGIRIGDYRGQGFTNPNNNTVRQMVSELVIIVVKVLQTQTIIRFEFLRVKMLLMIQMV